MSDDLILGILIGLVAGVILTLIVEWWHDRNIEVWVKSFGQDEDADDDDDEEPEPPALAIDPESPPRWRIYQPKGEPTLACDCHGIPFEVGQSVMWWPVPDGEPGAVHVLCETGVGMSAPVPE